MSCVRTSVLAFGLFAIPFEPFIAAVATIAKAIIHPTTWYRDITTPASQMPNNGNMLKFINDQMEWKCERHKNTHAASKKSLPFLVGAIEHAIWTCIRFWFITAIHFTVTVVIVQSFHWYGFARL